MTKSIDDILAGVKRPEAVEEVCLRGDLVAEYERLERQLRTASKVATSLGEPSPAYTIAQRMEALRGQMVESTVEFKFRALPPRGWSDLSASEPDSITDETPAEDKSQLRDAWHAWVCAVIAASCYEPQMTVEQASALAEELSNGQLVRLFNAAYLTNAGRTSVPFSDAAFELLQGTGPK